MTPCLIFGPADGPAHRIVSIMNAAEIRKRFLEYFESRGHTVRPSSSLVPSDDPTLLFTNSGMVQFKRIFVDLESAPYKTAVTSQKCVRAGGKHNDLEQVGITTRHHTFFEMLGNFSFGEYFKRDAIAYAWEFLVDELGIDPERLFVTVHHTDDEAEALWTEVTDVPLERIFRLGDKDNFWQMADTGPCGPCSEIHFDARSPDELGTIPTLEEFEEKGEAGEFLELWNLVFMQFDRDASGTLNPLPAPSIDTGAGLERLAAVLQCVDTNYHTDLFLPLLDKVSEVVGRPYQANEAEGVSYRVLADHARSVAFMLADGVFPSSDGRGYVLRRILRRGVRHAWLLGLREPSLVHVVEAVVDLMGDAYPDLKTRRAHLIETTRAEENRFLATIDGGMSRFEELTPMIDGTSDTGPRVVDGAEVFRLYDTFGFPLDLTELMARERGYEVDVAGFDAAMEEQRARSRADRASSSLSMAEIASLDSWTLLADGPPQTFRGYEVLETTTRVVGRISEGAETGLILEDHPFYAESGGQVSDSGRVEGEGWTLPVARVAKVEGVFVVFGTLDGQLIGGTTPFPARAIVAADERRDTERNHTATHLLHAALRGRLGEHVVQRGSLVEPNRLRFDFAHTAPIDVEVLASIQAEVNRRIWEGHEVGISTMSHSDAVTAGAMALFGEKYGDEVRVVNVPSVSMELCGGTHVRHTGEIGLFRIVSETGVAAGVRRIEALTGPGAFAHMRVAEERLQALATSLKTVPANLERRTQQILKDKQDLEDLLEDLRRGGGDPTEAVCGAEIAMGDSSAIYRGVRLKARDADDARTWGDAFLSANTNGAAVVVAELPEEKYALFAFVSAGLIAKDLRADQLVREVAKIVGGKGGGRSHMAQAGVEDPSKIDAALAAGESLVRSVLGGA